MSKTGKTTFAQELARATEIIEKLKKAEFENRKGEMIDLYHELNVIAANNAIALVQLANAATTMREGLSEDGMYPVCAVKMVDGCMTYDRLMKNN